MLAIVDVPENIMDLYYDGKALIKEILDHLDTDKKLQTVKRNTNLAAAYPASIVFIENGIYKYFYNDRFIRFYSQGDCPVIESVDLPAVNIFSEFATDVIVYDEKDFFKRLRGDPQLSLQWLSYQKLQTHLMHAISSLYVGEDVTPEINIKNYSAGDVIIKEGDPPDYIFEMIEGNAVVTVRGAQIGSIFEREIFGEVSFLTDSLRGATVTAKSQCLVQLIDVEHFEKIAKSRPAMAYALSKTLAKRLTDTNKRLVEMNSFT